MLTTNQLTTNENISLSKEIALVGVKDTPLVSLLMANGNVEKATSKLISWRQRVLDNTANITVEEGSDLANVVHSQRSELNNAMEIMMKGVEVSGSAQATAGTSELNDLFGSEINDRLIELKISLEKALINGVKDDGSVSGVRKMDGLLSFVDNGNKVTSNTLEEATIKALVRKLWEAGTDNGEIYAMVNADLKEQIDDIYKERYGYQHKTNSFGLVVSSIDTNYGTLNLVLNRYVPVDKIVAFNLDALSVAFLREPQFELLGKTGDSLKGMVLCEAALKVATKKAVAELTIA